jgi:hypothetical protein
LAGAIGAFLSQWLVRFSPSIRRPAAFPQVDRPDCKLTEQEAEREQLVA